MCKKKCIYLSTSFIYYVRCNYTANVSIWREREARPECWKINVITTKILSKIIILFNRLMKSRHFIIMYDEHSYITYKC